MIVQKFGGTSMGSNRSLRSVVKVIRRTRSKQVIVVSAMSGVTNILLRLIDLSLKKRRGTVKKEVEKLLQHHTKMAESLIKDEEILQDLANYFGRTLGILSGFLKAIDEIGEVSIPVRDAAMAVGEKLSARLLAGVLTGRGIAAEQVDLEKIIPRRFHTADHEFYVFTERAFGNRLKKVLKKDVVPVVTGYFGHIPGGILDSVGRGYSDFCAALSAAGLNAKRLEIWTDVSGIYTADPRKIKNAKVVDTISFEAAAELAHFGANVIHPQSIHPAIRASIPVLIKNTFERKAPGTKIISTVRKPKSLLTSVTNKKGATVVNIASYRRLMQYGFLAKIFEIFARHQTSIDVVSTSEVSVSVTIENTKYLKEIVAELKPFSKVTISRRKAIICLVGLGMASKKGVAGEVFTTLGRANISVDQISQGANEINITFIVDESVADKAVAVLHKKFF